MSEVRPITRTPRSQSGRNVLCSNNFRISRKYFGNFAGWLLTVYPILDTLRQSSERHLQHKGKDDDGEP
jgi:hypothetical protein